MKRYLKPLLGVFFIFLVFGLLDSYRSVLLPQIKADFNINYKFVALIFFLSGLGYIAGNLLGGELAERIKKKANILIGVFLIFVPIIIVVFNRSYPIFLFLMFIIGVGQGMLNTISNILIMSFKLKKKGGALSLLHSFYGMGALLTPLILSQLLSNGVAWRNTFILLWVVYALLIFYFILIRIPETELVEESITPKPEMKIFENGVIWFYLTVFFYMGSEVGLCAWLIIYLQKFHSFSINLSSLYLTFFFVALTISRLIGGFLVDKFHYLKSSIVLLLIVLVLLIFGLHFGKGTLFLLPLTGLFYGTVFPNITVALKTYKPHSSRIMGVFLASASFGAMLFIFLIGFIMDSINLQAGMLSIIFFTIITIICLIILMVTSRQLKSSLV